MAWLENLAADQGDFNFDTATDTIDFNLLASNFGKTGLGPTGNKADPPMPLYKLKHEDAQAVVDYLKTLQ